MLEEVGELQQEVGAHPVMVKGTCSGKLLMNWEHPQLGGVLALLGRDDNPRRLPTPPVQILRRHPCGPEASMCT